MLEYPDIEVYRECLEARIAGEVLKCVRGISLSVLRTVTPRLAEAHGAKVIGVRRLGKRVVIELEGELFLVIHLMIDIRGEADLSALDPGGVEVFERTSRALVKCSYARTTR